MRYRDGRRSVCLSSQSGCPLTCTFCATGPDAVRPEPDRQRDPRPGAPLPPDRADRSRRLHGDGRADAQPRPGARGRPAAAGSRHHPPANDDLDRRLAAGPHPLHRRGRGADPARALAARGRPGAPQQPDARQRPLSARRRARRVPALRRAARPAGLRRVRDARRRERQPRARRGPRARPRRRRVQGEPDPVQPDGRFDGSSREAIDAFKSVLGRRRIPSTVRLTRGREIAAACGQLAAEDRACSPRENA